jgi:hypothetical protein
LVIRENIWFWIAFVIFVGTTTFLKFFWYDKLEK